MQTNMVQTGMADQTIYTSSNQPTLSDSVM